VRVTINDGGGSDHGGTLTRSSSRTINECDKGTRRENGRGQTSKEIYGSSGCVDQNRRLNHHHWATSGSSSSLGHQNTQVMPLTVDLNCESRIKKVAS
jgi:hypothetical protein